MERVLLNDKPWAKIEAPLPGKAYDSGVTAKDNRLFPEAVLWIHRTRSPWRDLSEAFGPWHSV